MTVVYKSTGHYTAMIAMPLNATVNATATGNTIIITGLYAQNVTFPDLFAYVSSNNVPSVEVNVTGGNATVEFRITAVHLQGTMFGTNRPIPIFGIVVTPSTYNETNKTIVFHGRNTQGYDVYLMVGNFTGTNINMYLVVYDPESHGGYMMPLKLAAREGDFYIWTIATIDVSDVGSLFQSLAKKFIEFRRSYIHLFFIDAQDLYAALTTGAAQVYHVAVKYRPDYRMGSIEIDDPYGSMSIAALSLTAVNATDGSVVTATLDQLRDYMVLSPFVAAGPHVHAVLTNLTLVNATQGAEIRFTVS